MQTHIEPPLDQWQVERSTAGSGTSTQAPDRRAMSALIEANAQRLGTGHFDSTGDSSPIITTGHQAWLWHPGILAKDIAMSRAASHHHADMFHLVVDQDVHESLHLELPVLRGGRLLIETVALAGVDRSVPTGCQPAVNPVATCRCLEDMRQRLGASLTVDLGPIIEAFTDLPPCKTLAQQITIVIDRLRSPYTNRYLPVFFVSDLCALPAYRALIEQMLGDAKRCVASYNQAVIARPAAHVTALRVEPDRVELPLWLLRWGRPRERVFADLAGSPSILTLDDGQPIEPTWDGGFGGNGHDVGGGRCLLAPRALMMTAVLRRWCCDLFIHGRGGGVYDRVTEDWWRGWLGEELAPIAVVSADVTMRFDAPITDTHELHRAVWWHHHLHHNIDRAAFIEATDQDAVNEKQDLIRHMDDDRDPHRRAEAFARIQTINDQLTHAYPELLEQAQRAVENARLGMVNRLVASKRDWCFGLYEPEVLADLVSRFDT